MSPWMKALRGLSWLGQLGFSLVTPPLLCIWLCLWLQGRFGLGPWVVVLGILFGLGGSAASAATFYRAAMHRHSGGKKPPTSFNGHS